MNSIGIVTISFNQGDYIADCISSVGGEMCSGDQHVIVDPGSTDNSRSLIIEASNNGAVMALLSPDRGPADGLNKGFSALGTDIRGYLNSDDFLFPGCFMYVRKYMDEHPDVDVLIGSIKMAGANGIVNFRGRVPDAMSLKKAAAGRLHYFQQATFFRKRAFDLVDGFNVGNRTCWDYELIIDMAIAGARIAVTSKPLAGFRIHGKSITGMASNTAAYLKDMERIQMKITASGILPARGVSRLWVDLEYRLNPVRFLKQLRPV